MSGNSDTRRVRFNPLVTLDDYSQPIVHVGGNRDAMVRMGVIDEDTGRVRTLDMECVEELQQCLRDIDLHVPVIVFDNNQFDLVVHQLEKDDHAGLYNLVQSYMGGCYSEVVLTTNMETCPRVRLFLYDWVPTSPVNFRLQTFLHRSNMPGNLFVTNCALAIAVGISADQQQLAGIPLGLCDVGIPAVPMELLGDPEEPGRLQALPDYLRGLLPKNLGSRLELACKHCSSGRQQCEGGFPCNACVRAGCECIMHDDEMGVRARAVHDAIVSNKIAHHDMGKYLVHLQASQYGGYMLKTRDAADISSRVARYRYNGAKLPTMPPMGVFDSLPDQLKGWVEGEDVFKIEWMKGKEYYAACSGGYREVIMSESEIDSVAKKRLISPKVADTGRFGDPSLVYTTWISSLEFPGSLCEAKGPGYWKDDRLGWCRVRMISVLYAEGGVITITMMDRCYYPPKKN